MRRTAIIVAATAALLTGCSGDDERRAGGVSADEAQALDDAAEMIEARRLPDEALAVPSAAASLAPVTPAPR